MTIFFICAALLVLLSMAWLLHGVFKPDGSTTDQEAVNITLARERRATLDTALAEGAIDQSTYDYEREQLEYDLAADLQLEANTRPRKGGQLTAAILVGIFLPISAGALYLHLGNPGAITQDRSAQATQSAGVDGQSAPALADLLPQMQERLEQQPDDVDGWRLLGRSYLSVGEFAGASNAFERALALDDTHVPTMAQLAESKAMLQGGTLAGEPLQQVERAIELDPDNEHALWLLAIAQQQAGDHEAAIEGFDRLTLMAQGDPEATATVEQMRARSVAALGEDEGSGTGGNASEGAGDETSAVGNGNGNESGNATTNSALPSDTAATELAVEASASIDVTVTVSEEALASSDGSQTVFIYAVATNGPPMPLAVSRLSVADLPTTITLDNSSAMIPTMTLSAFDSVTVGARISASGDPIAQTGDWFTEAADVVPQSSPSLELTIDRQTP